MIGIQIIRLIDWSVAHNNHEVKSIGAKGEEMPYIIKINGIIGWEVEIEDIRNQLKDADGKDIIAEIASPGGIISEGLLIYNELKNYKGNVDTHLAGEVASMATYIAMVGKHRTAENNAVFMIHNGLGLAIGDHRAMFKYGTHLESLTNIIAKEYALKSETELSKIRDAMDETTFYYGNEIKEAGFVHEMAGDEESDTENRAEVVAMAELMIDECQVKINTPELVKKDMAALATMMADEDKPLSTAKSETKDLDKFKKQKKEDKAMKLEDIKAQHSELYKEIMALGLADGVAQERARVKMLVEMRAKFPKAHSQKVIDLAIAEGHDLNQVSINLMSADQVNAELEKGKKDKVEPPANGGDDVPEMKDGKMTHPDHVDAVAKDIASLPGVM